MLQSALSRRGFLRTTTALSAATLASMGLNYAHAAGSDKIRTGVIGCGGRGSGAVGNHMDAAKIAGANVELVAAGDMFPDKLDGMKKKWKVPENTCFSGFDAYKQVIDAGVDLVILATPPGFRPTHFKAAVDAGKHVFMEKPVATDPTGIRTVMEGGKIALEKKTAVVAGTQRRHDRNYLETVQRIHQGAIGNVIHMSVFWNGGGIWWHARKPGWTDMEWQLRNWYHHIWLCGDQICEQHIHNLDVANWVMNSHPVSAYGLGGRQVRDRIGQPGEIWDHFCIEYEYPNGGRVTSQCRHWPNSANSVSEFAIGTAGTATPANTVSPTGKPAIKAAGKKGKGGDDNPYVLEHVDLLKSIMDGKPLNEAQQVAESTLVAIMGRMSCYTGKLVTWDQALNSKLDLMPKELTLQAKPPEIKVPQPGETQLI
jgi:predicted dehydrogenase